MTTTPKLLVAGAVLLLVGGTSCSKLPSNLAPIPIGILHTLEQTPFQSYLDSSFALASDTIFLTMTAAGIVDPNLKNEIPGQAEIAYAFRTSVAGAVTSLGLLLPSRGYQHTVTLWDSVSGAVLAQTNVPSLDSGKWTYVSLALDNEAVLIQPGHGYIIRFNSLAAGNAIGVYSPGNEIYELYGIYDFSQGASNSTFRYVLPFTMGAITFEGEWIINYDTPISAPIFPGGTPADSPDHGVPGVCDIGFIPE